MPSIKIGTFYAYLLPGFLTEEKCNEMIKKAEQNGWSPALVNGGEGHVYDPSVRKCNRVNILDHELATELFENINFVIPSHRLFKQEAKYINPMFHYLKYEPGEYFRKHYDGTYTDDKENNSHITIQIYLNEGYEGGETIFYDVSIDSHRGGGYSEKEPIEIYRHVPKRGDILLFDQGILHEGAEVKSGIKLCVRTEVMY